MVDDNPNVVAYVWGEKSFLVAFHECLQILSGGVRKLVQFRHFGNRGQKGIWGGSSRGRLSGCTFSVGLRLIFAFVIMKENNDLVEILVFVGFR